MFCFVLAPILTLQGQRSYRNGIGNGLFDQTIRVWTLVGAYGCAVFGSCHNQEGKVFYLHACRHVLHILPCLQFVTSCAHDAVYTPPHDTVVSISLSPSSTFAPCHVIDLLSCPCCQSKHQRDDPRSVDRKQRRVRNGVEWLIEWCRRILG